MSELTGHLEVYDYLNRAITLGQGHAFCLLGPNGVGKSVLAVRIIQKLFCQSPKQGEPDGDCLVCRQIASGQYSEVLWLAKQADKKNISIEAVRQLKEFAFLSSRQISRRVAVIEGVENLSDEAANALIKILEEPPQGFLFLLLANNQSSLLPTILSRCQVVKLGLVPESLIAKALLDRGCSLEESKELAVWSQGRPGLAFYYHESKEAWQENLNQAVIFLNILTSDNIWQAAQNFLEQEFKKDKDSDRAMALLIIWSDIVRDILLMKLGLNSYLRYQNLKNQVELVVRQQSLDKILVWAYAILAAQRQLNQNGQVRLAMDYLISKLI